ncbi:MAG TPA: insulinase family protein, partial [Abditibacteriaceae bacterium]|nr:insulinase family protein [Abditibacteriaceae bacterium]
VEEAKLDVEGELTRRGRDSITAANDLAYQIAFAKHPYRRPAAGTSSSVEALTVARVRAYHQMRYVGANITVVVVGDAAPDTMHKLIAQHFATASAVIKPEAPVAVENKPLAFRSVTRRIPGAAPAIILAFRSPAVKVPADAVALDLLLAYWREGRDARMRRVLLGSQQLAPSADGAAPDSPSGDNPPGDGTPGGESPGATPAPREPLALGYDVDYLTQRDPGLFMISLVVEPDKRAAAVKATLDEIARVQRDGLDAAALQHAKAALTYQYVGQSGTVSGQAGALGFYDMIDSYQFAVTYLQRVAHVGAADVKRVADKYLSRTAYVQAVIEPEPIPPDRLPGEGTGAITAGLDLHLDTSRALTGRRKE